MPKACAFWIVLRAIAPQPIVPNVRPASRCTGLATEKSHTPRLTVSMSLLSFLVTASMSKMVCVATSSMP